MCHRADHREPESVVVESVGAVARLRAELRRTGREIRNLRRENEKLREGAAPLIHGAPGRERFAFIEARRGMWVPITCATSILAEYLRRGAAA